MKHVLVTGASGNLGFAVVQRFTREEMFVMGTVRPGDTKIDHYESEHFKKFETDLLNEAATQQCVSDMLFEHRHIDVLIATAGGFAMGNLRDSRTTDIYEQVRINFESAYNMVRPVFLHMQQQHSGRIFLIASHSGINPASGKNMVGYTLAKAMLVNLANILNEEGKEQNVVTTIIAPGTIDTFQNRQAMPASSMKDWVTPEQIAEIIYFYSTEAAEVIRGGVVRV